MASSSSSLPKLALLFLLLIHISSRCSASAHQLDETSSLNLSLLTSAATERLSTSSMPPMFSDEFEEASDSDDLEDARRSLFWRTFHYYISYGALSANRIPCPPRSGRSYYTHNCYRARGPVRPYYRGCSAITRCRR
ncbi:Protein RALF-like 34 [Ancistrocladus abbreviatus]